MKTQRYLPSLLATLLAAALLVVAGCDSTSLSAPEDAAESLAADQAASFSRGSDTCPGFEPPTDVGVTNTSTFIVVNPSCEFADGFYKNAQTGELTLLGNYLPPITLRYYQAPPPDEVCLYPQGRADGGACFTGPPNDGQLYPIPVYIYSPPVSPPCPPGLISGRSICAPRFQIRNQSAVIGTRG